MRQKLWPGTIFPSPVTKIFTLLFSIRARVSWGICQEQLSTAHNHESFLASFLVSLCGDPWIQDFFWRSGNLSRRAVTLTTLIRLPLFLDVAEPDKLRLFSPRRYFIFSSGRYVPTFTSSLMFSASIVHNMLLSEGFRDHFLSHSLALLGILGLVTKSNNFDPYAIFSVSRWDVPYRKYLMKTRTCEILFHCFLHFWQTYSTPKEENDPSYILAYNFHLNFPVPSLAFVATFSGSGPSWQPVLSNVYVYLRLFTLIHNLLPLEVQRVDSLYSK